MAESALSLVERLVAALDRAEEIARATTCAVPWAVVDVQTDINVADIQGACGGYVTAARDQPCCAVEDAIFIAANGPDVVLRTVAAHRKILDRHAVVRGAEHRVCAICGFMAWDDGQMYGDPYPCPDVLALAAVYFPEETANEG